MSEEKNREKVFHFFKFFNRLPHKADGRKVSINGSCKLFPFMEKIGKW
jgi:hypothetical protein